MTKDTVIEKTIKILNLLPKEKLVEVAGFADFIFKKHKEHTMQNGIERLIEEGSQALQFLNDDEYLYTIEDIKEKY
ncbi:MAG TPA: hypothetical protein VIM16_17210 [Mucilaginibacter sp.]|jgi:superfamily II RNA helicase